MKEEFLHYIWKYKKFNFVEIVTTEGEGVEILQVGNHNIDSGPDFFSAKLKIGETIWSGNVEIHINSSDWDKHNHQIDDAYNNVILHVVYNHDKDVFTHNSRKLATLELNNSFDIKLLDKFNELNLSNDWIACSNQIKTVDDFVLHNWFDRLLIERLERKSSDIKSILDQNLNNWEDCFLQLLFKYFGFKVNRLPFELLARSFSSSILSKHPQRDSVEALLFGQAGFLNDNIQDEYFVRLKKEYSFLKSKFTLTPIDNSVWKYLRLRPSNFPTVRIAQLAKLLSVTPRMFSQIVEVKSVKELNQLFNVELDSYWMNHYSFGKESKRKSKKTLGKSAVYGLIINVVSPILFTYGKQKSDENLMNLALELLKELPAENNSVVSKFKDLGIEGKSAFESQALLQLKGNYCSEKKCLNCSIGNYLLNH